MASKIKTFTTAEIAAYNATHLTPHRKIQAAQATEAKLLPRRNPANEFAHLKNLNRGQTAEQVLEMKMLHGEEE